MTAKQLAFCHEYVIDRNATKAAQRAGYSEKSAYNQGSRLMNNDEVRARVRELIAAQFKRNDVTADRIYDELAAIAFSDMERYGTVNEDGSITLFGWEDMPRDVGAFRCVSELVEKRGKDGITQTRIKMHDKILALRELAKLKGLDPEDTPEATAQAIRDAIAELDDFTFVDPPPDDE